MIENAIFKGNETIQYRLMTDASLYVIGGVLCQLPNSAAGTNISSAAKKDKVMIMFISKGLLLAESRYSTTERKPLAIMRCLEEVR